MKFIILGGREYEGYDSPIGACESEIEAIELINPDPAHPPEGNHDYVDLFKIMPTGKIELQYRLKGKGGKRRGDTSGLFS